MGIDLRGWPASRIGLRLFAFNLLVLFAPVVGMLYLDVYETRLLEAQERQMVQQGRLLAAALAARGGLGRAEVADILTRLERQSDARLRVYDAAGALIADSARAGTATPAPGSGGAAQSAPAPNVRERVLYRLGAWIVDVRQQIGSAVSTVLRWNRLEPSPERPGESGLDPELRAALDGRYGAATRPTPGQRSLTLFSAVPVRDGGSVIGAVVVSQSTFRVLQALYDVRLRIFQVVVASVLAAALLTALAAMTIVRPLRRLQRQASALAERRAPLPSSFPGTARRDELGDLARALEELTRRLDEQIGLLEGFAADVSHEFKNPLASIRIAAETIRDAERPEDRQRFLWLLLGDVDRLERLVTGVRELARIDGELEHQLTETVRIRELLQELAERQRSARAGRTIAVTGPETEVRGARERLAQVFDNLLGNAASFAPDGTTVEVDVASDGHGCVVSVCDRGPGIPEAHLDRVFERFFTYRPVSGRGEHVGLGLSIAKRIVEGYGGSITARNRPGGGARFDVRLAAVAPAIARR
jgi:two-component system sensor histidine kinase ChvG